VSSPANNKDCTANNALEAASVEKNGDQLTSATSASDESRDRRSGQESGGKRAKVQPTTSIAVLQDDTNIASPGGGSKVEKRNHDEADEGNDKNQDECAICDDGGDLICCDGCEKVYHAECLLEKYSIDAEKLPDMWHCPSCNSKEEDKTQRVAQTKNNQSTAQTAAKLSSVSENLSNHQSNATKTNSSNSDARNGNGAPKRSLRNFADAFNKTGTQSRTPTIAAKSSQPSQHMPTSGQNATNNRTILPSNNSDTAKGNTNHDFASLLRKHRDETKKMLHEAAAKGQSSIPISSINWVRSNNLQFLRVASFSGRHYFREDELLKKLIAAESQAQSWYLEELKIQTTVKSYRSDLMRMKSAATARKQIVSDSVVHATREKYLNSMKSSNLVLIQIGVGHSTEAQLTDKLRQVEVEVFGSYATNFVSVTPPAGSRANRATTNPKLPNAHSIAGAQSRQWNGTGPQLNLPEMNNGINHGNTVHTGSNRVGGNHDNNAQPIAQNNIAELKARLSAMAAEISQFKAKEKMYMQRTAQLESSNKFLTNKYVALETSNAKTTALAKKNRELEAENKFLSSKNTMLTSKALNLASAESEIDTLIDNATSCSAMARTHLERNSSLLPVTERKLMSQLAEATSRILDSAEALRSRLFNKAGQKGQRENGGRVSINSDTAFTFCKADSL